VGAKSAVACANHSNRKKGRLEVREQNEKEGYGNLVSISGKDDVKWR